MTEARDFDMPPVGETPPDLPPMPVLLPCYSPNQAQKLLAAALEGGIDSAAMADERTVALPGQPGDLLLYAISIARDQELADPSFCDAAALGITPGTSDTTA